MASRIVLLTIAVLGAHRAPGLATDLPGSAVALGALAACHEAARGVDVERHALLDRGLALAERATASDDADAAAHFAVFCNLGRRIQLDGLHVWQLGTVHRLRRELDRTLELAPSATAALVAKAAFLLELPRLFGGDPAAAEEVARRAVASDPASPAAHLVLARTLAARGAPGEARHELAYALGSDDGDEARTLLATLGDP